MLQGHPLLRRLGLGVPDDEIIFLAASQAVLNEIEAEKLKEMTNGHQ
jgi:hypothetical protein